MKAIDNALPGRGPEVANRSHPEHMIYHEFQVQPDQIRACEACIHLLSRMVGILFEKADDNTKKEILKLNWRFAIHEEEKSSDDDS